MILAVLSSACLLSPLCSILMKIGKGLNSNPLRAIIRSSYSRFSSESEELERTG